MGKLKLSVAGPRQSIDFQKTANVFASLEHLFPALFVAEILEFDDEVGMTKWVKSDLLPMLKLQKLPIETASVVCWIDDSTFLGNAQAGLAYARDCLGGNSGTKHLKVSPPKSMVLDHSAGPYDYDVVVIGGGSGGLAFAKRAAKMWGAKVALLDFVKPSPKGTKWGLGGTCVNVGCIPKKLMHTASLIGESLKNHTLDSYGFVPNGDEAEIKHDWTKLVGNVQDYIKSLNFGYRVQMREAGVNYMNRLGRVVSAHEIEAIDFWKATKDKVTARYIVVAVGCRPRPLGIPGEELAISSDDLFSLAEAPGKTLVVGASYVALECAGLLRGLGFDVSIMVRSILLRGFDEDMAERTGKFMEEMGLRFVRKTVPTKLTKLDSGRILVHFTNVETGEVGEEEYDTVIAAIGRDADTKGLNLELGAGVAIDKATGKLLHNEFEQTNVANIFAIGDILLGKPELTPVAIHAGKLLADRLFGNKQECVEYDKICTTVFTPLEYSCVGMTEEQAKAALGEDLEVYHSNLWPLEWTLTHGRPNDCYLKVLVDLSQNGKIVGLHYLGPNAGEVIMGFGVAFRMGMTFHDLTSTIGIHPTCAEEFTLVNVTKRSGLSAEKTGC